MKEIYNTLELTDNIQEHRFEMKVGANLPFIEYSRNAATIMLTHTEVAPELEGQGAATAIIEKTLHYIKEHGLTFIPLCPLVVVYIKRHPEWDRLVYKHH